MLTKPHFPSDCLPHFLHFFRICPHFLPIPATAAPPPPLNGVNQAAVDTVLWGPSLMKLLMGARVKRALKKLHSGHWG